ncbi:thymidine phosphorylase [Bdellovibrionota bacterium FG-1]
MKLSPAWVIQKKRDGQELDPVEIQEFIHGVTTGEIPDYQATAFLMAVFFKGMTAAETSALTQAMLKSGEHYSLSAVKGPKVDKHSTGGVGDKVSIILAPLAAACGIKVPMMAGRGLGHSGGTLDKMEAISGFEVQVPFPRFVEILQSVGCAIIGQSAKIAPADKKLYALRDVTATVECIPLIVASILSKKIAEGTDALILDVKVGNGAFMKTRDQARKLAQALTRCAKKLGLPCRAILTNMDQPLGRSVGNALEVAECIAVLRNEKYGQLCCSDLKELTIQLCAQMLVLGKVSKNIAEARKLTITRLADGSAWKCFEAMVKAQGGDLSQIQNPKLLPTAPLQLEWKAKKRGYISKMNTETIGRILIELGGGRKKATDHVDHAVGLVLSRKLGARVAIGDTIAIIHAPESISKDRLAEIETLFQSSIEITAVRKPVPKLIIEII